jgi:hypothetical protein
VRREDHPISRAGRHRLAPAPLTVSILTHWWMPSLVTPQVSGAMQVNRLPSGFRHVVMLLDG